MRPKRIPHIRQGKNPSHLFILALLALFSLAARAQTITTTTVHAGIGVTTYTDIGFVSDSGLSTSQAIVNGNPAISYRNYPQMSLMFARNTTATGSGTWITTTVSNIANVGAYSSLAIVNGNPAISYFDDTTDVLKYVRALNANGTSWGTPVTVDNQTRVGRFTSLVVVNGNPAIAYLGQNDGGIRFVRATNANGTGWGTPIYVDNALTLGPSSPSLAIVNGNPAICHLAQPYGDLLYVRANNANGTSWGTSRQLTTFNIASYPPGFATSLVVVNGNPAVAYYDRWVGIRYMRALDVNGTSWDTGTVLDTAQPYGIWASLKVVNGNPAVSYFGVNEGDLKYVRALDASGTNWSLPMTVDSAGNVGAGTSLAVVNGNAAISYSDLTTGDLKWATLTYTPQENWRQLHFGTTGNSGDAADGFDFDKDGLANLVEFAFALSPKVPDLTLLPQLQLAGGTVSYSFTEPVGMSGITYGAEWSATLLPGSWTPIADTGVAPGHTFNVPEGSGEKVFVRLVVTAP